MVSPIWPDEQGRPLPTYPCPRPGCGREVAVRFRDFRVEHLRHVGWQAYRVAGAGGGKVVGLNESQRREVVQLILVAREYLRLAKPRKESESLGLSHAIPAFTRTTLSSSEWSQTMTGAHLSSSAVRLVAADEILEKAETGSRHVYTECRAYFYKWSKSREDIRGSTCSEWFHVMLRDVIGHREGDATEDTEQKYRYDQRLRCIEQTSFLAAHARLQQTADELVTVLTADGIVLPGVLE